MNKIETKHVLDLISALDNRKVTPETIEAWHGVIGHIPFDIAKEALKLAQQDATIKYLEPRHIVGWAKEAAFRLDREKPKQEPEQFVKVEQPTCKHLIPVMKCNPCCRELSKQEHLTSAQLLLWAKANIYA
jgi:hypothetical protein